jgi:hypothetical protein
MRKGALAQEPPRLAPVVVTPSRNAPAQTVDDILRQVPSFSLFRRSASSR